MAVGGVIHGPTTTRHPPTAAIIPCCPTLHHQLLPTKPSMCRTKITALLTFSLPFHELLTSPSSSSLATQSLLGSDARPLRHLRRGLKAPAFGRRRARRRRRAADRDGQRRGRHGRSWEEVGRRSVLLRGGGGGGEGVDGVVGAAHRGGVRGRVRGGDVRQ